MAKELILSGRVQGVFCRDYCSKNARSLGLKGVASNLRDGTVQVILDSNDDQNIEKFINFLKKNPNGYRFFGNIDNITINDYSGVINGDYIF
jgi:acylphosphatase